MVLLSCQWQYAGIFPQVWGGYPRDCINVWSFICLFIYVIYYIRTWVNKFNTRSNGLKLSHILVINLKQIQANHHSYHIFNQMMMKFHELIPRSRKWTFAGPVTLGFFFFFLFLKSGSGDFLESCFYEIWSAALAVPVAAYCIVSAKKPGFLSVYFDILLLGLGVQFRKGEFGGQQYCINILKWIN